MKRIVTLSMMGVIAAMIAVPAAADHNPRKMIEEKDGLIRFEGLPVPEHLRNPALPEDEETAYWRRANDAIDHYDTRIGVRTHGEMEKASYPITMFNYLLGHHDRVMEELQTEDAQAGTDHAWTKGIDLYWAFTLKGQMRKYFLFGPDLDPDYRERMKEAGGIWTEDDPRPSLELVASLASDDEMVREYALKVLRKFRENIAEIDDIEDEYADEDLGENLDKWMAWWKQYADEGWQVFEDVERRANPFPHPRHDVGTGPIGGRWDPEVRGTRADARNTDNLRAMREISVYLMAEEAGNEEIRRLYKDKIRRFVVNLYRVHHGEWDSENYLHHTIGPFHNLYDFADDEKVVGLAKAAMDYLYTAAAVKYYNHDAVAPTKRTGGGLDRFVQIFFGPEDGLVHDPYYDLLHTITSAYRPPMAVIQLGRNEFPRPAEMVNSKPTYSHWLPGAAERPETWETVMYGKTYYLGTANSASPQGDVRPWEMRMDRPDNRSDRFMANTRGNFNGMTRGDQIGHYRNLVVYLRQGDGEDFHFALPDAADAVEEDGLWFVESNDTYLAVRPINIDAGGFANVANASGDGETSFSAGASGDYSGFALIVGERPEHGSFEQFRRAVRNDSSFERDGGTVTLTGMDDRELKLTWNDDRDMPIIYRDGEHFDWDENKHVYQPMDDNAPVSVQWRGGTLRVVTNDHEFEQTVHDDGTIEFDAR